jgi:ribonuclease Z
MKNIVLASLVLLSASGQTPPATPSGGALKVVILGSGGTPQVDTQRYGPAILVEAAGERLLFDCGRAAVIRMAEAGIALRDIDKIFLTHLHSDHILSLPDVLLSGWTQRRITPLRVWGPAGTADMMNNMVKTFDFDIHLRRDVDERFSAEGIKVAPTDIEEGVIYEHNGVKVTAFLVDHGPVQPAFGYRVDAGGHSVALSGDTRFSENLIKHVTGVDVLIHEVFTVTVPLLVSTGMTREQAENIVNHHTTPAETGTVFDRVKPRLAIYAHGGGPAAIASARANYSGPLESADDLTTILIGETVEVQRRSTPARR